MTEAGQAAILQPDRMSLIKRISSRSTLHGVLLRVHGVGVLLTGAGGIGKSVLALELLARGHALVADDAVDIWRGAAGRLTGHAPPLLRGVIEVRGLGILEVRRLYGKKAVRARQRLDLIVRLSRGQGRLPAEARLAGRRSTRRLLGEKVPVLSLGAGTGHNLPVLVEAACLDQRLRMTGFAADRVFSQRQQKLLNRRERRGKLDKK